MNFTRKIDRAMQWAGEKMGAEAKATHTDEFKALEAEMDTRHDGMERLHKSMNHYTRWVGRRCEEDRNRSTPLAALGRNMTTHGAEIEQDSEFGRCLVAMGNTNEQIAELQNSYLDCANATWVQQIERNLAMMKEYQSARKKLESRRLAYDATMAKMQKGKRDDIRVEEELRINKTKFDDSTEDVYRRMQDIKEAEADSVAALTSFLDAELEYHERAANELRQLRRTWAGVSATRPPSQGEYDLDRVQSNISTRSQHLAPVPVSAFEPSEANAPPLARKLTRTMTSRPAPPPPPPASTRPPPLMRSATFDIRHQARVNAAREDAYNDDTSTCSGDNSPVSGDRSLSPATSYGSLHGSCPNAMTEAKKVPPPPPVNRARKPPPPPVPRKVNLGY
ncbi:Meiotically up-regulated gene protein [Cladobotryum mycophilum]|uniref:Meiotically up-regulated gene protein n=1 Tax=Cladobotryum mycophilum TaxID=491253 RepID=A0ABR0SW23_9HYPO